MKINVEPERLESAAIQMEKQIEAYEQGYKKILMEVEHLENVWKGKDNVAFVLQIKGFTKEFQEMSALMYQYKEFLLFSARKYRETQAERIASVKRLVN